LFSNSLFARGLTFEFQLGLSACANPKLRLNNRFAAGNDKLCKLDFRYSSPFVKHSRNKKYRSDRCRRGEPNLLQIPEPSAASFFRRTSYSFNGFSAIQLSSPYPAAEGKTRIGKPDSGTHQKDGPAPIGSR
jgi:hypothetical protein